MEWFVFREQLRDAFLAGYWGAHPDGQKEVWQGDQGSIVRADEKAWAWADARIAMMIAKGAVKF